MSQKNSGKIVVWGDGSEKRDLIYIDDLVDFVSLALDKQTTGFEIFKKVAQNMFIQRIGYRSTGRLMNMFLSS